jgi:hypothetical protein
MGNSLGLLRWTSGVGLLQNDLRKWREMYEPHQATLRDESECYAKYTRFETEFNQTVFWIACANLAAAAFQLEGAAYLGIGLYILSFGMMLHAILMEDASFGYLHLHRIGLFGLFLLGIASHSWTAPEISLMVGLYALLLFADRQPCPTSNDIRLIAAGYLEFVISLDVWVRLSYFVYTMFAGGWVIRITVSTSATFGFVRLSMRLLTFSTEELI